MATGVETASTRASAWSLVTSRLAIAAVGLCGLLVSFGGLNTADEAWFLQVVARVADGEALYRDVFFGATPLSVYATVPFVAAFGPEVAWVKLVVVACFVATLVLVARLGERLGLGWGVPALLLALLVFSPPYHLGPYQQLANVLLLACLAATLASREAPRRATLVAAGALAGLAFATKQNVGAYALAALIAAVVLQERRLGPAARRAGEAAAAFVATAALAVLPVAVTGGFSRLLEFGFLSKGAYVDVGGISYFEGVRTQLDVVREAWLANLPSRAAAYDTVAVYELAAYALAPAALGLVALAWWRAGGERRRILETVGVFSLAAFASIFPRADAVHVGIALPILLLSGALAVRELARGQAIGRRRLWVLVALALLIPAAVARVGWPVVQGIEGGYGASELPHFRGVLVHDERETDLAESAALVAREARGEPILLATTPAGFLYLAADVRNPTPFDFPFATSMGLDGEADVVAAIARGEIPTVCLGYEEPEEVRPRRLVGFVEGHMRPGADIGPCTIFRLP